MLVAAVVILAGVVVVASGRGGEMVTTEPDYPPIDLGPVTSADVALLRPPSAAWGYNMRVTDEALEVIAKAVTERDVHIAALEQEVSDLRDQLGGDGRAATVDRPGRDPEPAGPESAGPELPEPDWPRDEDTVAAAPGASVTRPQPIYHPDDQGETADEVHFGPGFGGHDEAAAEPPDESAEAGHEPAAEAHPGWSADPADTSPDARPVDLGRPDGPGPDGPDGETSVPVTPATAWRVPEPSVWDEASRQVEQEQARAPGQEQAQRGGHHDRPEFHWDEDPHQRVVWGAEHARAKAARATEETLPNAEHPGDRD
jgi:hypothetical protein